MKLLIFLLIVFSVVKSRSTESEINFEDLGVMPYHLEVLHVKIPFNVRSLKKRSQEMIDFSTNTYNKVVASRNEDRNEIEQEWFPIGTLRNNLFEFRSLARRIDSFIEFFSCSDDANSLCYFDFAKEELKFSTFKGITTTLDESLTSETMYDYGDCLKQLNVETRPWKVLTCSQMILRRHQSFIKLLEHSKEAGLLNKPSISLNFGKVLRHAFDRIVETAAKENLDVFVTNPFELTQVVDATYQFNKTDNVFTIVLHIPMLPKAHQFRIKKYLPASISFKNANLTPKVGSEVILVVNDLTQYKIFNLFDFSSCPTRGRLHFCPASVISVNSLHETCLGGLHMKDLTIVEQFCNFEERPDKENLQHFNFEF
jgi:hypothetical protein